jgi:hypothetical protein
MSIGHRAHRSSTPEWPAQNAELDRRLQDPRVRERLAIEFKVNQSYDVPYLAGISKDNRTLYVDLHFPLTKLRVDGELCNVTDPLWVHECGEKAFIELYGDHYLTAHRLITIIEHRIVTKVMGLDWKLYNDAFEPYLKPVEHEKIRRPPPDLFLRPYIDSGATDLVRDLGGYHD